MHDPLGDEVARCLVTALLVESAVYTKPGLVDRINRLPELDIINLQTASVAFYRWLRLAAISGARKAWSGRLGKYISHAVEDMLNVQGGGNTHLGALLLLFPISCAAGLLGSRKNWQSDVKLRRAIREVLERTVWRDCIYILRSISMASPGGLGNVSFLDVKKPHTYELIKSRKASIIEVFRNYRGRDMIIDEYLSNYSLTFDVSLKTFKLWLKRTNDLEVSAVNALLAVMSKRPDTHISRRKGIDKARIVMSIASKVLRLGGVATKEGRKRLSILDEYLRSNDIRPGASADILDATLAIFFLGVGRFSRDALLDFVS